MARFTERQLDDAKNTDLAAFLRSRGEKLVRSGSEYRWVYRDGAGEHDSISIRGNRWFDHKRQIGGDAIGFLQEFDGMTFREAVAALLGGEHGIAPFRLPAGTATTAADRKTFILPPKAPNMHRLYAYLCKTRGISHEVVTHFVRAGVLYEDAGHHNAVFIAADEKNKPCGGMKKSTLTGSSFRQTIEGSDTRFAFHHKGSSGRLYVFEAAVDMLSYITLHPEDWQRHSYMALDGVSSKPLLHFLECHDDVFEICLCLDNDAAGVDATRRIGLQLSEKAEINTFICLPANKDWNEDLTGQIRQAAHGRDAPQTDMIMTF